MFGNQYIQRKPSNLKSQAYLEYGTKQRDSILVKQKQPKNQNKELRPNSSNSSKNILIAKGKKLTRFFQLPLKKKNKNQNPSKPIDTKKENLFKSNIAKDHLKAIMKQYKLQSPTLSSSRLKSPNSKNIQKQKGSKIELTEKARVAELMNQLENHSLNGAKAQQSRLKKSNSMRVVTDQRSYEQSLKLQQQTDCLIKKEQKEPHQDYDFKKYDWRYSNKGKSDQKQFKQEFQLMIAQKLAQIKELKSKDFNKIESSSKNKLNSPRVRFLSHKHFKTNFNQKSKKEIINNKQKTGASSKEFNEDQKKLAYTFGSNSLHNFDCS